MAKKKHGDETLADVLPEEEMVERAHKAEKSIEEIEAAREEKRLAREEKKFRKEQKRKRERLEKIMAPILLIITVVITYFIYISMQLK